MQLRAKNRRGNSLTCKPPTPPWRSPTGGDDLNNYIMILFAQGGRGREWVQQGPCLPTAPTTARHHQTAAARQGVRSGPPGNHSGPHGIHNHIHMQNIH